MLRSAHICRQCKQTDAFTLAGHPLCAECREKDKERQRKWRESDGGERNRQKAKKNRDKRAAAGLCVYCGKRTVQPGRSTCITCSTKQKERNRQRDIANGMNWPRGANGYCWQCNKQPVKEGFKLCPDCYEKKVGIINACNSCLNFCIFNLLAIQRCIQIIGTDKSRIVNCNRIGSLFFYRNRRYCVSY